MLQLCCEGAERSTTSRENVKETRTAGLTTDVGLRSIYSVNYTFVRVAANSYVGDQITRQTNSTGQRPRVQLSVN